LREDRHCSSIPPGTMPKLDWFVTAMLSTVLVFPMQSTF